MQARLGAVARHVWRGGAFVFVRGDLWGAEQGAPLADVITNVIMLAFDCRPGAMAQPRALREPKYRETAADSHFSSAQW